MKKRDWRIYELDESTLKAPGLDSSKVESHITLFQLQNADEVAITVDGVRTIIKKRGDSPNG